MANLMIYMITIFRQSKSSVDPDLAPVFVGVVQVQGDQIGRNFAIREIFVPTCTKMCMGTFLVKSSIYFKAELN
jgi:hypothetical protein